MLFNIVPEDFFFQPVQPVRQQMRCRRQIPDLELLRSLGLAPMLRRQDWCPQRRMSSDCCQSPGIKTRCCKPTLSTKSGDSLTRKQTTVDKALDFRGFFPEQIQVKVTEESVIVRGEKKNDDTHVQITKSVPLPEGADRKGVICRYEGGLVTVHIPGTEETCPEKTLKESKDEDAEIDARRKAEMEKSVKTLTDLFSTLFGIDLCQQEKQNEEEEKKEEMKEKETGAEKVKVEESDTCQADKPGSEQTEKTDIETEVASKEEKKHDDVEENNQCDTASGSSFPDKEQTCVLRVHEDNPLKPVEEDGFVHIETQEADEELSEDKQHLDDVKEVMTSLIDNTTADELKEDDLTEDEELKAVSETSKPEFFRLELDLSNYKPEQIRVVFKDGVVIVEAEREIERDNYSEIEKLNRQIRVPETVDETKLESYLSSEGLLTVRAPFKDITSS